MEGFPAALDVIEQKLRPGGILITDNLLWHGRIFDEDDESAATAGVRELTRRITSSDLWDASIVPIRDGLLLARKRDGHHAGIRPRPARGRVRRRRPAGG